MARANDTQVGGNHYAAGIQHWDFINDNGFSYLRGCATKYLTRYRDKNGVEDLRKAQHYVQKLSEGIALGKHCPSHNPDMPVAGISTLADFLSANNIPEVDHPPFWWILYGHTSAEMTAAIGHIDFLIKEHQATLRSKMKLVKKKSRR